MNQQSSKIGLILGQPSSLEVQSVYKEIIRQQHIPIIVDTTQIPHRVNIEYHVNHGVMNLMVNQQWFTVSQVTGVYWAQVESPKPLNNQVQGSGFLDEVVTNPSLDCACLMQMLFAMENLNWINSFQAIQFHRTKPMQLMLAQKLGARIPHTYIGSKYESIKAFLKKHHQCIAKPVFAGGHTQLVSEEIRDLSSIQSWATQPFTLQDFIPGQNIRTYIVGQFLISGRIEEVYTNGKPNKVSDYREADSVKLIPIQIPLEIQQLALRIMREFHMMYTAIDWRLTPTGEFVFLEANPAPLFVNAQTQLDVDLTRAIVDLMFA